MGYCPFFRKAYHAERTVEKEAGSLCGPRGSAAYRDLLRPCPHRVALPSPRSKIPIFVWIATAAPLAVFEMRRQQREDPGPSFSREEARVK